MIRESEFAIAENQFYNVTTPRSGLTGFISLNATFVHSKENRFSSNCTQTLQLCDPSGKTPRTQPILPFDLNVLQCLALVIFVSNLYLKCKFQILRGPISYHSLLLPMKQVDIDAVV